MAHLVYQDALMQWHIEQARSAREQQERESTALEAVRAQHADYDAVIGRSSQMQFNQDVLTALVRHPARFELAYYLAQHPDLEGHLARQYGVDAGLAVGLLAQQLGPAPAGVPLIPPAPARTPTQPGTQAPPPIAPTRGVGGRAPRDYDELSLHEFIDRRNQEERARWR